MVATLVLFGTAEADFRLQAFLSSTAAGGVLVMKLKLLSAYTVITTGMIDHKVPVAQVLWQIFLIVYHQYPQPKELQTQRFRQVLRPLLVIVPPHHMDRGNPGQLVQNGLAVDIPAVQDRSANVRR